MSNAYNATDLFITEYVEASSSSNSYIEIYNGTESSIDLSNYYIEVPRTSGGSVYAWGDEDNWNSGLLSGILNSGQILIVARSSGTDLIELGKSINTQAEFMDFMQSPDNNNVFTLQNSIKLMDHFWTI